MNFARALLLLPSGHRATDEEVWVRCPVPQTHGAYHLIGLFVGEVDDELRALYVLGGEHQPQGFGCARPWPDEAFDQ